MTAPARRTVSNWASFFFLSSERKSDDERRRDCSLNKTNEEEQSKSRVSRANSSASFLLRIDKARDHVEIYSPGGEQQRKAPRLGAFEAIEWGDEKTRRRRRQKEVSSSSRDQASFPFSISHALPPSPRSVCLPTLIQANRARTVVVRAEERTVIIGLAADSGAFEIDHHRKRATTKNRRRPSVGLSIFPRPPLTSSPPQILPNSRAEQAAASPPSCAA